MRAASVAWVAVAPLISCNDVAAQHAASPRVVDAYADLAPLADAIGGARVVALGEPNHAVGNIFEAQARVVGFLHDRLGFTVLAWEAGLWTCETDAAHCVGFPWGAVVETRAVRPPPPGMIATGFDLQPTGDRREASVDLLREKLLRRCARDEALASRLTTAFSRFPKMKHFRVLTRDERTADRCAFRDALAVLGATADDADAVLLRRAVENVLRLYDWHEAVHADISTTIDWNQNALDDIRDETMADNVRWLVNVRYRGRKVVLWLASFHAARAIDVLSEPVGGHDPTNRTGFKPMGAWLSEMFGTDYFALALSVDAQPQREGSSFRFVPRSALGDGPSEGNFIGLHPFIGPWGRVFDGALMFPSATSPTPEER